MSEAPFPSPQKRPIVLDGLMDMAYNREATLDLPDETLQTTLNNQLFTPELLSKPVDITAITSHNNSDGEPTLGVEQFSEAIARFEVSSELGERTVRLAFDNGDRLDVSHIMEIRQQEPEEPSDYAELVYDTGGLVNRVLSRKSFNKFDPEQQQLIIQRLTEKATREFDELLADSEHCQAIVNIFKQTEPIIADKLAVFVPVVLEDGEAKLLPKLHIEMTHGATKTIVPFDQLADIDLIYHEQRDESQPFDYLATFQDEWRSQSIEATEYLLADRATDLSQRDISAERVTKLMQAEAAERCAQLMADENFLAEHMLESGEFYVDGIFYTDNNGEWQETFDDYTINAKPELDCEEISGQWRFGLRLISADDSSQADVFVVPSNTFVTAFRRLAQESH
jgi:hypothetical protein